MIRIRVDSMRVIGRSTQGVTLIKMGQGDRIGSFTRLAKKEEKDEEQAPELPDETDEQPEEEESEE